MNIQDEVEKLLTRFEKKNRDGQFEIVVFTFDNSTDVLTTQGSCSERVLTYITHILLEKIKEKVALMFEDNNDNHTVH